MIDEALTGWWLTAREEPRLADLRAPIAERAACVAGLAVERAVRRAGRREGRPAGAGRGRLVRRWRDPHGRPAARLGRAAADHPDRRGGRRIATPDDDAPSAWLWAAVLAAGAQPGPRRVRGASRRPVAAASSPWPPPAGRSAGSPCAPPRPSAARCSTRSTSASRRSASPPGSWPLLAGAADVFRRPPAAEPALNGRRAALDPGRVPRRGAPRPARARARRRRRPRRPRSAGAMAVGVALLTALVARWPTEGPRAALRWAARLLAVALVACGAILDARRRAGGLGARAAGGAKPRRRGAPRRAAPCPAASRRRGRAG